MDNAQFGSGSSLLGGGDALSQVMAQQGLGQQSPASMGFDPTSVAQTPPMASGGQPAMPQGQPLPQESTESQVIIQALIQRLKMDEAIQKSQKIPPKPQAPAMGGGGSLY